MRSLTSVYISTSGDLGDYAHLGGLRALKSLRLDQNRIEAYLAHAPSRTERGLRKVPYLDMDSLEILRLAHNRVSDVSDLQLHRCPHLKELQLQSNHICHIGGFHSCLKLISLDISKNRIRQISPGSLVGLSMLRELRMEEAGLRSLVNLAPLRALNQLHLAFNRINDIGELERLVGVGCITDISMCNNPIARRQLYRPTVICQVPSICWIDGRDVNEEERERAELLLKTEQPLKFFLQDIQPSTCMQPPQLIHSKRSNMTVTYTSISNPPDINSMPRRISQRLGTSCLASKRLLPRG